MSEIITCNTTRLSSDQSSVGKNLDEIDASTENLRNLLALLDSMWDGGASEAFMSNMNRYLDRLQNVTNSMRSIQQYEGKAVAEYDTCERTISGMVSSISV